MSMKVESYVAPGDAIQVTLPAGEHRPFEAV
jgi:hypothetical protein